MYRLARLEISSRRFGHFASTLFSTVSFYVKPLFCRFPAVIAAVSSNVQRFAAGWSEEAPGQKSSRTALSVPSIAGEKRQLRKWLRKRFCHRLKSEQ